MVKKILTSLLLFALSNTLVTAQEFLDASIPNRQISVGVRMGINSSSQGLNLDKVYPNLKSSNTSWRAGFEAGAIVNLNIKNFFTIQPGFFFTNKSYNTDMVKLESSMGELTKLTNEFTHSRFYYFQIPVLASFRFNVGNDLKWMVDFGPYFALGLGGNTKTEVYRAEVLTNPTDIQPLIQYSNNKSDFFGDGNGRDLMMKSFDWGFKMGTGIMLHDKYSLSVYYSGGCKNVAQPHAAFINQPKAKNKQWSVTLGYDF